MAIVAPSLLTANPVGPNKIELNWQNNGLYALIQVERASTLIATLVDEDFYPDEDVADGTSYTYRVRGYTVADGFSDYSNEYTATTPLGDPTNLVATVASSSSISLTWDDNSKNETGFEVYRNGVLYDTVSTNTEAYTDTVCTAGTAYTYKVRAYRTSPAAYSAWTKPITITIRYEAPPAAPSNIKATTISTTAVKVTWKDNSDNETGFTVQYSLFNVTWGAWGGDTNSAAGTTSKTISGLTSGNYYRFRVKAYNGGGASAYSETAYATTYAATAQPTTLQVFPYSSNSLEITFDDCSTGEDDHRLERSDENNANYAEIATLAANFTYYRDTGLTANTVYYYRVRAKAGITYSGYSDENYANTYPSTMAAPTNLAIANVQDTSLRLTWTSVSNRADLAGYRIYQSSNGVVYTNIFNARSTTANNFLVSGLSPSTQYWFQIAAYSLSANSANATAANDTTLATYSPSNFEKFLRHGTSSPVYLFDLKTKMRVTGFTAVGGTTYTYKVTLDEPLIDVIAVYENGQAYTQGAGTDLDATAGSFSFNFYSRILYVHTFGGGDPGTDLFVQIEFWHRFTNFQDGSTIFNDHHYLGLLNSGMIPELSQEISPFYEGSIINQGWSIGIINGNVQGEPFWDTRYGRYDLIGSTAILRLGANWFTNYNDFQPVASGTVYEVRCTDKEIALDVRDIRGELVGPVPMNRFDAANYPNIPTDNIDKVIPAGFGVLTNTVPVCIDANNKKYKFQDGRAHSVQAVKIAGANQTEDTHFFVDYRNGVITFANAVTVGNNVVQVDYTGYTTAAGGVIEVGSPIFKYVLNEWRGIPDTDLDLDSIWDAQNSAFAANLAVPLYDELDFGAFLQRLEHSMRASVYQDGSGRIGIRRIRTTAPSNIQYVKGGQITGYSQTKSRDSVFRDLKVYYGCDQNNNSWSAVSTTQPQAEWRFRSYDALELYTYISNEANAAALAANYHDDLEKDYVEFEGPMTLLPLMPGDLFYLKRSRFYNANGIAWRKLMRIVGIQKNIAGKKVFVKAEVV
jgi:hypothetical protein